MREMEIPAITTEQMREVDRLAMTIYGISLLQMMENAGRNLAELARQLLDGSLLEKRVLIAVGKGNNGGGGMAAARHLYNWGAEVTVLLQSPAISGTPETQLEALRVLPVKIETDGDAFHFLSSWEGDLTIDALLGYGLSGHLRDWVADMIERINELPTPIVALDVPSGLDATTGKRYDPCIRATATMTLALPKTGLVKPEARSAVGALYLADIGIPNVLYKAMGIKIDGSVFTRSTLIELEPHL
jgi:NAD(P)H-hydrate epimerase